MPALRHSVAGSRSHCCHGNATIYSLFNIVGLDVAVNNIKMCSFAMEMQQSVPLALLSSYKMLAKKYLYYC